MHEEVQCKGPMEQQRCVFVVFACVDSRNGDLLLRQKGKFVEVHYNTEPNTISRTRMVWLG